MKAISLLLIRMSTGVYLILWGIVKLAATDMANSVSDKYYGGIISGAVTNIGLGALQVIIGSLVVLGLVRTFSYTAQLVWYFVGLVPIILYILDPFGKYFLETSNLLFFPSTTLLFASVIIMAFRDEDSLSLDARFGRFC